LDGPVVLEHAQEYITFQYMIVDFVHWSIDQWYIPDILNLFKGAHIINLVGEKSIRAAIKAGIIDKKI